MRFGSFRRESSGSSHKTLEGALAGQHAFSHKGNQVRKVGKSGGSPGKRLPVTPPLRRVRAPRGDGSGRARRRLRDR